MLDITKGEAKALSDQPHTVAIGDFNIQQFVSIDLDDNAALERTISEGNANAALIVDAFNTYQKCGKLPSELLVELMRYKQAMKIIFADQGTYDIVLEAIGEAEMNKVNQLLEN